MSSVKTRKKTPVSRPRKKKHAPRFCHGEKTRGHFSRTYPPFSARYDLIPALGSFTTLHRGTRPAARRGTGETIVANKTRCAVNGPRRVIRHRLKNVNEPLFSPLVFVRPFLPKRTNLHTKRHLTKRIVRVFFFLSLSYALISIEIFFSRLAVNMQNRGGSAGAPSVAQLFARERERERTISPFEKHAPRGFLTKASRPSNL